ncbi:MAG: hypothetical protein K2M75_07880, partial [Clostridia bacterium]|nr:hypothetical protein [Clostridia bacterium]
MNIIKNKSRLVGLTSVILILLVIFSFVLAGQNSIIASAGIVTPTLPTAGTITIGELLNTDRADDATDVGNKSIFNYANLSMLFNKLTGLDDATFDDVVAEMDKDKYNDGKFGDKTYIPNTSTNDYSNAFVGSIHYGMNAEDIRSATGGSNIEVEFGGYIWEVVTLTTTGQAGDSAEDMKAGHVVLTLMLKNPLDDYTTKWAAWGVPSSEYHNHSNKYSAASYSPSMIRAILLNGKDADGNEVKYATNATTLISLPDADLDSSYGNNKRLPAYKSDAVNNLNIFTDKDADKSVTNFLIKPKDVLYQQDENTYDKASINPTIITGFGAMPNDNSKNKLPSAKGMPTPTNARSVDRWYQQFNTDKTYVSYEYYEQEKSMKGQDIYLTSTTKLHYEDDEPTYFDWGNDYLWLPSYTEVGNDGPAGGKFIGLWALNNSQRAYGNASSSAAQAWLRSAPTAVPNAAGVLTTTSAGDHGFILLNTSSQYAIRPALNLDLTAAAESTIEPLVAPKDVTVEYTGSELDMDFAKAEGVANWWNKAYKDRVDVDFSQGQVTLKPKELGTYTAKLSLKDPHDTWGFKPGNAPIDIEFEVVPRNLTFPKWDSGGGSKTFKGSKGESFDLLYNSTYLNKLKSLTGKDYFELVDVTLPDGVKKQNNGWKYNAVDAKTYDLTFTIKDTTHYKWAKGAPSDGKLRFEVTKKTVSVMITADGTIAELVGREGYTVDAVITIPPNQLEDGYPAKITIGAQRPNAAPNEVSDEITLTDASDSENITLDLAEVSANNDLYDLYISCSSAEYEFVVTNSPTLKVEEDKKNVLRWQLFVGGKAQTGYYVDCEIDDATKTVTFDKKPIYYTGKFTEFKASATPLGYTLNTAGLNGGYEMNTVDSASTNAKKGYNADDYITKVEVFNNEDPSEIITFYLNWTIAPAMFDLSGIKWVNNGDLPYNEGQAVYATLDTKTLPKGLIVEDSDYSNNAGSDVGHSGTASV